MPKAKTRQAPRWRTAPGLEQGPTSTSTEVPAAPLDSAVRPRATRADVDRAPSTPATCPPRRGTAFPTTTVVASIAADEPPAASSSPRNIDAGPASSSVSTRDEVGDQAGRRRSTPPATPAEPPASEAAPVLAAPQIRLDAELPQQPRADHQSGADRRSGPPRTALARYGPLEQTFTRSVRSLEPISDHEAAAFAGRFAADFQSFDEDNPTRRAEVLRSLLADPQACTWGWSGAGRQRADSPLPGRIYRSSETVVFVEVVVRATTYARACPPPEPQEPRNAAESEPAGVIGPSCVPPESDPGWFAVEANWLRMTVPITRDLDDGRLVVDPHLVSDQSS